MAAFKFNFAIEDESADEGQEERVDGESERTDRSGTGGKPRGYRSDPDPSNSSLSAQADYRPRAGEVEINPFHFSLSERLMSSCSTVEQTKGKSTLICTSIQDVENAIAALDSRSHSRSGTEFVHQTRLPAGLQDELCSLTTIADSQHSDLIPGVYEGGLKVWECAFDLVQYLAAADSGNIQLSGSRVLELGCGAGLPGVFALQQGAKSVHFQDFNVEVLKFLTIPNVLVNVIHVRDEKRAEKQRCGSRVHEEDQSEIMGRRHQNELPLSKCLGSNCRFFFGDWSQFHTLLMSPGVKTIPKYDLVLTSETIYSVEAQPKLLKTIKSVLEPNTGVALIAAKSYYFGVGGSVQTFLELVESDGEFEAEICHSVDCSVPRRIVQLRLRK